MKLNTYILFGIIAILLTACNKNVFVSHNFEEKTGQHHSIAVLPVAIEIRGADNQPFDYETRQFMEDHESILFQQELFNQILRSTKNNKRPLRVNVQHYQTSIDK